MTIKVFGHEHCIPCKMYKESLTSTGIEFEYVDVLESPEEMVKYALSTFPTTIFFEDKDIIKVMIDKVPAAIVKEFINGRA